jgi:hypothetical protein
VNQSFVTKDVFRKLAAAEVTATAAITVSNKCRLSMRINISPRFSSFSI